MRRGILGAVAAVLLLSLVAPFIPADHYLEPTRTALERALGRKVEISSLRFRLLPQPGFTVSNVTIGEDPAIGPEPVAYVNTLRAIPRITALLAGRLEFASVDLEEASLNLTRVDRPDAGVQWNFSALMRPQALSAFPAVHIRSGRINFKFGDTKSLFYLLDTDLDLWPPGSPDDPWTLRVKGEPARTDRPARGFGSFLARGEWHPKDSATILDVKLEKSELSDMLELFSGHAAGIEGSVSGSAHLAGPITRVGLAGKLTVANVHGWNQSPPGGNEWPLVLGGVLDATGQTIDLTARLDAKESPLQFRYRASDYLRRPRWGIEARLNRFSLSPVLGIARNLGWAIPPDFRLDGLADGAVSYAMPQGVLSLDGGLMLQNSVLSASGAPPLQLPSTSLRFSGSSLTLTPTVLTDSDNETTSVEATWDTATNNVEASLSSDGMAVAPLSRPIAFAGVPLLSQATAGKWRGRLHYSGGGWHGDLHLQDTVIPFEAFSDPLRIVSADATIDGAGLNVKRLSLSAGGLEAQGEYRYEPAATRPHKFRLILVRADGETIEKLIMPALHRGNLFTYAFSFGRTPEPDWLRNMRADGTLQMGTLSLAGNDFTKVQTHVLWDSTDLRLTELKSQFGAAIYNGAVTVHLDGRQPVYEVEGTLRDFVWQSGVIDSQLSLTTSGTGADLLHNLHASGTFEGKGVDLTPLDTYESVTGSFDYAWDARNPHLHITDLTAKSASGAMQGTAETQDNGQVVVKLSDGARHVQAAGALLRGEALKVLQ